MFAIVCIGQLIAGIAAMLPGIQHDRWIYFALASLAIQWISLMSCATLYLFRHRLGSLAVTQTAWWSLFLFVLNAFLFSVIFWALLDIGADSPLHGRNRVRSEHGFRRLAARPAGTRGIPVALEIQAISP